MSYPSDDNALKAFATFPNFSKLTLKDRERYELLVRDYPPISDITFPILMQWWNSFDSSAISLLNGNIVISYWMPGDEQGSGLSLVGTQNVDESLCDIFDYLHAKNERARLVHVPEFVISHMHHPELFTFEDERTMDEYVVSLSSFYPLDHMIGFRRHRTRKFLESVDEEQLVVRALDLTQSENRQLLFDSVEAWPKKGTVNHPSKLSEEALALSINESTALGVDNLCLFVKGELHAFIMYHLPHDKRYTLLFQAKLSYAFPYLFDYTVYAFARWFSEHDVIYVNLDVDFGMPMLRVVKLALGPQNFFRKYTIEPKK